MADPARFSYTTFSDAQGTVLVRPIIPLRLYSKQDRVADALLDTGADVNVLPYSLGLELGASWNEASVVPGVSGNLAQAEARAILLDVTLASFSPVRLLFVWLNTDTARLLLGQINFFQEFNVCFYASADFFEISYLLRLMLGFSEASLSRYHEELFSWLVQSRRIRVVNFKSRFKKISAVLFILGVLDLAVSLPQAPKQANAAINLAPTAIKTCPDVVKTALDTVDKRCASTGRNSACYGNVKVEVEPQADAPKFSFSSPGDKAPLKNIQVIRLNNLSADDNSWGIVVLRIQANLPDSAPGQNVTMLLFGNVQITNGSKTAVHPTDIPIATQTPVGTLSATQSAASGAQPKATVAPTSAAYRPMQAFYFSSGVGEPSCKEAPQDGILIQSPQGSQKIDLLIDDARVVIGSTVFLQAQASKELIVYTLEGAVEVSAFGQTSAAAAGSRVRVPIDANLKASGPPSQPEPYDMNVINPVPAQHLPQKITAATPIPTPPSGFTTSTWRFVYGAPTTIVGSCVPPMPPVYIVALAMNSSGSVWVAGQTLTKSASGSYSQSYNMLNYITQYEFHLTSPTHGEGQGTVTVSSPACTYTYPLKLDLVGGTPLVPTAAATVAP